MKQLSVLDYFNIFKKNRKRIILFVTSVTVLSIILAFFIIEPVFLSTGLIKTTAKSSPLGGLLGGSGLPDLGDFGDLASGGGAVSEELALYENILLSRKCLEEAIIKFNIMEIENFKYMYDALKYFRENIIELSKDKVAGTLAIGVYDVNPARAKEIADFLIYKLNQINVELNVQEARNNRVYIEERFKLTQVDLTNIEDSLQAFQDIYGISPEVQVQAALKGELEIESMIKTEEVKLELLKKILASDQPEVKAQQQKIEELKKQLNIISSSEYSIGNLNLKGSPKVIMDYLRLKREVEIQNKILTTLVPILEQAKISENKETPTILILDTPQVPDKKAKPKRLFIVLGFFFGSFFLSYSFFFLKHHYFGSRESGNNR